VLATYGQQNPTAGMVTDTLQITRPQRTPDPASATSWTPQRGLQIRADRGHPRGHAKQAGGRSSWERFSIGRRASSSDVGAKAYLRRGPPLHRFPVRGGTGNITSGRRGKRRLATATSSAEFVTVLGPGRGVHGVCTGLERRRAHCGIPAGLLGQRAQLTGHSPDGRALAGRRSRVLNLLVRTYVRVRIPSRAHKTPAHEFDGEATPLSLILAHARVHRAHWPKAVAVQRPAPSAQPRMCHLPRDASATQAPLHRDSALPADRPEPSGARYLPGGDFNRTSRSGLTFIALAVSAHLAPPSCRSGSVKFILWRLAVISSDVAEMVFVGDRPGQLEHEPEPVGRTRPATPAQPARTQETDHRTSVSHVRRR
jgi:hypothetical protein